MGLCVSKSSQNIHKKIAFTANRTSFLLLRLSGIVTITALVVAGTTREAGAQAGNRNYTGSRYSSGTISSATYTTFDTLSRTTLISTRTTQGGHTLGSAEYFGYNVAGAPTGGQFIDNPNPYPDGWEFGGSLVQSATTGAAGAASVTFIGNTTGTQAFTSNTWIKGATESGGMWNVRAGQANFLGGYTNADHTGSVTLNLGAQYTAFGTLIGTNPGANLDVSIVGYNTAVSTTTPVFTYTVNDIVSSTANPTFTGYLSYATFNRVVITGLSTSTGGSPGQYTTYPNAAFIALDQFEVGYNLAVPEPASALFLLPGIGILLQGIRRRRGYKQYRAGTTPFCL